MDGPCPTLAHIQPLWLTSKKATYGWWFPRQSLGQTATSDIIGIRESNVLVKSALVELMAQQYTLYQKESDDVIPNYL